MVDDNANRFARNGKKKKSDQSHHIARICMYIHAEYILMSYVSSVRICYPFINGGATAAEKKASSLRPNQYRVFYYTCIDGYDFRNFLSRIRCTTTGSSTSAHFCVYNDIVIPVGVFFDVPTRLLYYLLLVNTYFAGTIPIGNYYYGKLRRRRIRPRSLC